MELFLKENETDKIEIQIEQNEDGIFILTPMRLIKEQEGRELNEDEVVLRKELSDKCKIHWVEFKKPGWFRSNFIDSAVVKYDGNSNSRYIDISEQRRQRAADIVKWSFGENIDLNNLQFFILNVFIDEYQILLSSKFEVVN